jgi:hypothetical protein
LSEKFFYEGLVVFDFDHEFGPSIEMPWRSADGKHEDLTLAILEEALGVEPNPWKCVEVKARARITVEFL